MSISEKLVTIAENEQKVYDAGFEAGKSQGGNGYYDKFWDTLQDNGNRKIYDFAFSANQWTPETFKPKYPIRPTSMANTFGYWGSNGPFENVRIDLRQACVLDTSDCTLMSNTFTSNQVVSGVGIIDARKSSVTGLFSNAINLEIVELLILKDDGSQSCLNTFNNCSSLAEIRIEGVIGKNINFQWSPLSRASIENVISHLSDTTSGLTVNFSRTAKNTAFTDDEWASLIATKPNWTISLV